MNDKMDKFPVLKMVVQERNRLIEAMKGAYEFEQLEPVAEILSTIIKNSKELETVRSGDSQMLLILAMYAEADIMMADYLEKLF